MSNSASLAVLLLTGEVLAVVVTEVAVEDEQLKVMSETLRRVPRRSVVDRTRGDQSAAEHDGTLSGRPGACVAVRYGRRRRSRRTGHNAGKLRPGPRSPQKAAPQWPQRRGLNPALGGQRRSIRPSPATWVFALIRRRIW